MKTNAIGPGYFYGRACAVGFVGAVKEIPNVWIHESLHHLLNSSRRRRWDFGCDLSVNTALLNIDK